MHLARTAFHALEMARLLPMRSLVDGVMATSSSSSQTSRSFSVSAGDAQLVSRRAQVGSPLQRSKEFMTPCW